MKGEIIRRMSLEIIKDEVVIADPARKDTEADKVEDKDDYLVKTIGAFGLWQGVVSLTVLLTRLIATWNTLSVHFLTPVVEFVCVEFSGNVTSEVKKSVCYDACLKYNYSSVISRSVTEDFGLICRKAWLASLSEAILMLGFLVGVLLFGWISDKFGRRKAMLLSTLLSSVFMVALPFSPSYIIYTAIRFGAGFASGGTLLISVVQVMEIIGKKYIELTGVCVLIPVCLGQMSLAGFAYFTSNWQGYTLSYGVATCIIFLLTLFVPESPRWLVASGKVDEAAEVITIAANRNKLDTDDIRAEIAKALENIKLNSEIVKVSYLELFKRKSLFIPTLVTFLIWFSLTMSFNAVYHYATILGCNPYLTVILLGLVPIPFLPISIIFNKKFGRKNSIIGTTMCIAVTTFLFMFVQRDHWLGIMLGAITLITCYICLSITYVHVSELYPTTLRNMGFALPSCGAMIGSMIYPFIATMFPLWLPSLIVCIFLTIAWMCYFVLPETKGQNLRDAVEE